MTSKIRVLDENTINKIAAGEVIENPSSVVKEFVENAIDAGATEITVEIKGGGRQLIRITDNGCGMSRDDALLSLERHATSKIRDIDDIHAIETMGFRGEAVPSIASISKLTILTRREEDQEGTLVIVDGGRIISCSPAARASGTTFEVKSLFFNVPVRKKFQRSPTYDTNEILKIVTMQALAHPDIKFQLISNQKNILSTKIPRSEKLIGQIGERISDVLGADFFAGLCPIEKEQNGYKLIGYCGLPSYNRHNRTGQHLFINKRTVFSPIVSYAVRDAYGTALATNRHPVFVLFLTMDGSLVDVNVHPQKKEVRLRQEYQLKEIITFSIEEALQHSGVQSFSTTPAFTTAPTFSEPPYPAIQPSFASPKTVFEEPVSWNPPTTEGKTLLDTFHEIEEPKIDPIPLFPRQKENTFSPPLSKVIATLKGYLLLSSIEGTLQLLDQRAAHAKILYEKLLNANSNSSSLSIQNLLIPLTIELATTEAAVLRENLTYINDLGLQIQEFGNNSFIIHSIPHIFGEANIEDIILEIVHELRKFQNESVVKHEILKKISQAAGRSAISQDKKLTIFEGQSLYNQLMKCQSPFQCPNGKRTIIELTQEDIAKQFQN